MEHPDIGRVYFFLNGSKWRVYDAWLTGTKRTVATPPQSTATMRIFVAESGPKQRYVFAPGESRLLEKGLLEQQLRRSVLMPGERFYG